MVTRAILVSVLLAACGGGKGDECEQFFEKTKPVFAKQAADRGKTITDADKPKFVEMCRQAKADGKTGDDGLMKCVLAANGDAAVAACMQPAFGDYMQKSKRVEAELQLNKLGKLAKVAYVDTSAFPVGSAPLTPATPCCGQPDNKCAVAADAWLSQPMWQQLDFVISEPHRFQYSVESDGKQLTAKAVGDLDCDGTTVTYTLEVTSANGTPAMTIVKPTTED